MLDGLQLAVVEGALEQVGALSQLSETSRLRIIPLALSVTIARNRGIGGNPVRNRAGTLPGMGGCLA